MLELLKQLGVYTGKLLSEFVAIVRSRQRLLQFFRISLYSNTIYLLGTYLLSGLSGLVFWVIAARLYDAEDVGLASAVIAALGLLANFANLGLGHGLIRFIPHSGSQANGLFNSSFTITILASLLAAAIFLAGLSLWSPALLFLRQEPLPLIVFVALTVAFTLRLNVGDDFFVRNDRDIDEMRVRVGAPNYPSDARAAERLVVLTDPPRKLRPSVR